MYFIGQVLSSNFEVHCLLLSHCAFVSYVCESQIYVKLLHCKCYREIFQELCEIEQHVFEQIDVDCELSRNKNIENRHSQDGEPPCRLQNGPVQEQCLITNTSINFLPVNFDLVFDALNHMHFSNVI